MEQVALSPVQIPPVQLPAVQPPVPNSKQKPSYRLMIFTWNTESVGLCETMDTTTAEYNRTSYLSYIPGITAWRYDCNIPDFYPKFSQFIVKNCPDLVIIGFQEDRYPGSYFHSHLLPLEMPKMGYELVKRTKLMGVGVTTYKGMLNGDLFERGIRVSIYAKHDLVPIIEKEENEMRAVVGNDGQSEYVCSSLITRGKGATASYIILPGFGRIALICCHLPFNARSLIMERVYKNKMLRQNEINECNVCFNNIIENLVLFKEPSPTHVIYFGDFNYRLADPRLASEVANDFLVKTNDFEFIRNMYINYDELREQMRRNNIYEFSEGISNQGPTFIPTCKMVKGRITEPGDQYDKDNSIYEEGKLNPENVKSPGIINKTIEGTDYWKTGAYDQRVPSWCDRILYRKFGTDGNNMICTYYDRFDVGAVMAKSDHAGVISMFELY